jgi:hypothetical protein
MDDAAAAARKWVQWEEVVVSNDRGRRLVHYYLRGEPGSGAGGGEERELAVVGRERSPRHMWYAVQGRFLRSLPAAGDGSAVPSPSQSPGAAEGAPRKWRSRREVVDWLRSLVSGKIRASAWFLWLFGRWIWAISAGAAAILCYFCVRLPFGCVVMRSLSVRVLI